MKKNILLCFLMLSLIFQTTTAQFPDWKEKIQLYGHAFSVPNDFTSAEFQYIADHYKIFTVEKRSAYKDYGGSPSTEAATIGTAAKLKALNPDIKVLLYWNAVMSYEGLYTSNIEFAAHPEWVHSVWPTGYDIYDLENIACQDWWVNSVVSIIREGNLDGVFYDAGPKADVSGLSEALFVAMDRVNDSIETDLITVFNGYRVAGEDNMQAGPDYIEHTSGVFIEFFLHDPLDTKEEAALLFDKLTDAYSDGKMIVPRGTPSSFLPGAEDPFLFSFASFLLFYGPNSYYIYNSGYNKTEGTFDYYPEYFDIATGESLGSPKRNGWVYTREFEHYSVRVDLANKTASISKKYQLKFKVTHQNENLSNVTILLDNQDYVTDSLGEVSIVMPEGQYSYSISKLGCDTISHAINLAADTVLTVQLLEQPNNIRQLLTEQIKMYPTPSSGYLSVESPLSINKLTVYNLLGEVVQSEKVNSKKYKISTLFYEKGVYLLTLELENKESVSTKFIVR